MVRCLVFRCIRVKVVPNKEKFDLGLGYMTTIGFIQASTDELHARYTTWYSYARMLRLYRWVYGICSLLVQLIILKLYVFNWELGLTQALVLSLLSLLLLTISLSLFIDSSFALEKYGAEAEARKLINYNIYLTSLASGLWGGVSLVIIYHNQTLDYELLALLGILVCLNIPRVVILPIVFYIQISLIVLPGIFFMLLQGRWVSASMMIFASVTISIAVSTLALLLKAQQDYEQQLLVELRQPQRNNLLNSAEFSVLLKLEWQYAAREHHYLSAIQLEFEPADLKKVNQVVSVIRSALYRPSDCLAYLDAATFKLLLPNTSAEQVLLIAERLQGRFAQEDFDSEEDLRLNLGLVTCSPQSLKSTHTAQTTSAIDEFLACLDRSLAEAKTQEGRFVLQAYSV